MRIRLAVAIAVLFASLGLAQPASAALPPDCHLAAGKIVAWTSTTTRSVDARWPGFTCSTPGYLYIQGDLWSDASGTWVQTTSVYGSGSSTLVNSLPGATIVAHCTHRAQVRIQVIYMWHIFGFGTDAQSYRTNAAICS